MPPSVSNQVAAMAAILERMERQSEEDRRERKSAHRETELARAVVSAELNDIRHSQIDVVKRLDKIEPITDLVTSVRSRVTGGVILLGFLGGIAWAGVLFFKETIQGWFS
jgi:hypothetical protein